MTTPNTIPEGWRREQPSSEDLVFDHGPNRYLVWNTGGRLPWRLTVQDGDGPGFVWKEILEEDFATRDEAIAEAEGHAWADHGY